MEIGRAWMLVGEIGEKLYGTRIMTGVLFSMIMLLSMALGLHAVIGDGDDPATVARPTGLRRTKVLEGWDLQPYRTTFVSSGGGVKAMARHSSSA